MLTSAPAWSVGSRPRNDSQICFGHADPIVNNRECLVGLVWDQPDEEFGLSIKLALVGQALESNLIKSLQNMCIRIIRIFPG
ncbi:hypothetical protein AALP_AA8G341300 [Arabis alpina]|uniref:Uncharacterized protein n=1 Tax=Arabis alpina TaxID=50452 RepID=A0A087GB95_ARAAL|nr:hypothetical protein AALP_AA8G341300 [Arabis alpina]